MEEVDRGTKPIEAVGTAVAAFVGYTEIASETPRDRQLEKNKKLLARDQELVGVPTAVTNWSQFVQRFGGFVEGAYLPDAVYGYFANGGGRCYVVSIKTLGTADEAAAGTVGATRVTVPAADDAGVPLLEFTPKPGVITGDAPAHITVKPDNNPENTFTLSIQFQGKEETFPNLTTDAKGERYVQQIVQSSVLTVRVLSKTKLVPAPGDYTLGGAMAADTKTKAVTIQDYQGDLQDRTGVEGLAPYDDITMICVPDLMSLKDGSGKPDYKSIQNIQTMIIDFCERVKYCFAILDAPPGLMPEQVKKWRLETNYDSTRAALYYPWIEVPNQIAGSNGKPVSRLVPPSGHIAGIYARNDAERGVHKAPANEVLRSATGLQVQVTKGEQDALNPIGVNCIRAFPGRGIRVWGARTLSSNPSWRYINVRRLFNMIEDSIERGTQWVVFEPNDPNLWARVRRDVGSFLKLVWRSGALFGDTPEQAFYVKCDAETNPPEVRDVGQLIIEIGLAPVKPAEFVIFRVSQWAGPDSGGE
jgi:phage tail sheath protein FI